MRFVTGEAYGDVVVMRFSVFTENFVEMFAFVIINFGFIMFYCIIE